MLSRPRPLFFVLTVAFLFVSQPFYATLIPPFYLDCVVALGRKDPIVTPAPPPGAAPMQQLFGPWTPEASGFLYGKFIQKHDEKSNDYRVYLVTNRHVVEEHDQATKGAPLWVRFNLNSPGATREYDVPLRDPQGKPTWHFHPNALVDIAVLSLNVEPLRAQGARFDYFRSEDQLLTRAKAKELGLTEGDGVYVLGFPMGIIGQHEDYVIVRQGTIARVRDMLDATEPTTFLVDSFIFPGNSGGPVILRPELISVGGTSTINKAYLLGVVKDYIPYIDTAFSLQTKRPRVTFEENSGLADVIPADYIEETIADYEKTKAASPPSR